MNRNESFAAFCNRVAAHVNVRIPDGDYTLPEEYNTKAKNLLDQLMQKKKGFPTYPITFIQKRFEDLDEVKETLSKKTVLNLRPALVSSVGIVLLMSNSSLNYICNMKYTDTTFIMFCNGS